MSENVDQAALGFTEIAEPDPAARQAAAERLAGLSGGPGATGVLGELGCWLAATQGACPPRPPRARIVLVAADHGIAAAGVSARAPGATAALFDAVPAGSAPVAVAAQVAGVAVRVVDAGVDRAAGSPADGRFRVRRGSGRIDREDALTAGETAAAVQLGRELADAEADSGTDLLVATAVGVAAATPAAAVVAALTGTEPVAVVGRILGSAGIDDQAWMRKVAAIRDALRRARPHGRDPLALLRTAGGADLALLTGLLAQAAVRRTPVLLDGLVAAAAGLLAEELAPGARRWWLPAGGAGTAPAPPANPAASLTGTRPAVGAPAAEPALAIALQRLQLEPVADLRVRLGDGTAAAALLPLFTLAARLLTDARPAR